LARQILRAAYQSGVTLYDTADVYGGGLSEERIASWRRADRPEGVFIATKLGRRAPFAESLTPAGMRAHTEDSLRRLQTESLDLTQLHCVPTDVLRRGEVFETLRELQREGKIRRFGASVESAEEGLLCLEQPGLASLQVILNIFRQKPLEALLPRARAQGVAVLVRLPLASGLLSGKFTPETRFDPSDHRRYNRDGAAFNVGETFAGLPFEKGVALADELKPQVSAGMTMAQWAQRWCLDQDGVTSLLTGASRPEQATENAKVSALSPLSEAQRENLSAFYEKSVAGLLRGPN
jgi:aryl-alcohol dehydrogenase-like predicted oxidoreductase